MLSTFDISGNGLMAAAKLIGTWRLISWILTDGDGTIHHPLGQDAVGRLIYTADGFMSAMLATASRPRAAGDDPLGCSAEDSRAAMATFHTYSGRYRFEGASVVHAVDFCLFPNMVGSEQRRFWRLDGDRLHLTTPPLTRKGASGTAELVWERERT
jgi:hypothetical protein